MNLKKAQAWFIVVIVLFSVNLAHALDFDKEIRKQEKVIVSVRQGLTHRDKIEKEEVKEQKKQDFQIVLLPKGSRN